MNAFHASVLRLFHVHISPHTNGSALPWKPDEQACGVPIVSFVFSVVSGCSGARCLVLPGIICSTFAWLYVVRMFSVHSAGVGRVGPCLLHSFFAM